MKNGEHKLIYSNLQKNILLLAIAEKNGYNGQSRVESNIYLFTAL